MEDNANTATVTRRPAIKLAGAVTICLMALHGIAKLPDVIVCEGTYAGHLQGVATDGKSIYWSFTKTVVRTDLSGRKLAEIEAPSHQGDLCVKDSVVYVAVNLGRFNQATSGVSKVMSYDAKTLKPLKTWDLDMPHGAGGMTWAGDRFFVIGGLPATHERNYVHEYDSDFKLVQRHELATGFTLMGIQTAAFEDSRFLFGIYGCPGCPGGVLTCPPDLSSFERWLDAGDVGMVKLDGDYFTGRTYSINGKKGTPYGGKLVRDRNFPKLRYHPVATGKGRLVIFFEGRDATGWEDADYALEPNGYKPLCANTVGKVHVKVAAAGRLASLPAVGIGGTRSYSAPDLVRAVRRAAEMDEVIALHLPGTPDTVRDDIVLETALDAVCAEAKRLGVRVSGL